MLGCFLLALGITVFFSGVKRHLYYSDFKKHSVFAGFEDLLAEPQSEQGIEKYVPQN